MRKPLGILILAIGIIIGGFSLYDLSATHYDIHDQSNFYVGIAIGLILCIVGIIMINSGKKKEKEQAELKKILMSNPTQSEKAEPNTDNLDQLEKLGKLKERGMITEEEFQQQKKKLLE